MDQVVKKYLQEAKHCLISHNYGKAYAFYLLVLKLCPHLQRVVANDFGTCWREWSAKLREVGRINDLFSLYEQGCDVYMGCEMLHYHMGNALFHLNCKLQAIGMFRKALYLNEHFSEASISLENACRGVIDSWHFSMLNDQKRNFAFDKAIQNVIKENDVVLDIGSGTGILSMLAAKHTSKTVYGCEMSEALHYVACECVTGNKLSNSIRLKRCHSANLAVGGAANHNSIPEKCSVVITETVDAGLLGEGIIDTLSHAWKSLLIPKCDGGRVIPGSAKVFFCLVECEILFNKHNATNKHSLPGALITSGVGFKSSTFQKLCAENCIDNNSLITTSELEPYTSETLCSLPFKALSNPIELTNIDFNDFELVEKIANGLLPNVLTESTALDSGFVDAVVLWFNLQLEPNSKSTIIDTSIGTEHCWDQAVYPVRNFNVSISATNDCSVTNRVKVQKGDVLKTVFQVHCDCFYLHSLEVTNNCDESSQTFAQSLHLQSVLHVAAAEEYVERINDPVFSNMAFRALCELKNWNQSFAMLDISNGLDLFAIKTAKAAKVTVHKYCQTPAIGKALKKITENCDINVTFHETLPLTVDLKFDAIVSHVIEPSGLISPSAVSNICKVKQCLSWSGFILPNRLSLIVRCVESYELLSKCMVLSDKNTLGLNIAETVNDFRVSTHSDLDIRYLNFSPISNAETIMHYDFNEASAESLLSLNKSIVVKATKKGVLHAILFWFQIHIYDENVIDTTSPNNHWKQAAYVFPRKKQIKLLKDDEIVLKATTNDDSILFQASTYGA